jgi:hypothetical protein
MTERSNWIRKLGTGCALAIAALALAPAAQADSVLLASGSSLTTGRQTWVTELNVQSGGMLSVQVTDLGVPMTIIDRLGSLSFSVTNSSGVLGSINGSGLMSLEITTPGLFFLNISAAPLESSRFKLGLFSWTAWNDVAAPVPLPASLWLLIGGLAWAMGMQRKGAKLPGSAIFGSLRWRTGIAAAG